MALWDRFRRRGTSALLRQLAREQHAQTLALQEIARSLRTATAAQFVAGFSTGAPDGVDDSAVDHTRNSEIVELLAVEAELAKQWGRKPSEEEVVREWESRLR